MSKNIVFSHGMVTRKDREAQSKHQAACLWFTGLSGSGKSTIAKHVEKTLFDRGIRTYLLDGDNVRHGLNRDLGFSPADREENIRRIAEVAALFVDAGMVVLVSFISPFRKDRASARAVIPENRFIEVYVKADLETCIRRDPKGLYKKALAGEIGDFTGVSSPYEEPEQPELLIDTTTDPDVASTAHRVTEFLESRSFIARVRN